MIDQLSKLTRTMLTPHILLVGLLLLAINIHYEYVLYHVNTYKIFMLGLSALILVLFGDYLNKSTDTQTRITSWKVTFLLALPMLATMPGYLWHSGHNYNFRYELVTDMFLLLWAVYVFRSTLSADKQLALVGWFVVLALFLLPYSVLEFYGLNPLNGYVAERPKATFGNINYFAGFLATVTPVLLVLALPRVRSTDNHYSFEYNKVHGFFALGLFGLVVCAILAQSRAALGATAVAAIIVLVIWSFSFLQAKHRKYVLIALVSLMFILVAVIAFAYVNPEFRQLIIPGRFANLFQQNAWWGRTTPLIGAFNAFMASPFVGWGLGSSYNLNFLFMPVDTELYLGNRSYNHVHNEFLEMAEEGGILMLLVWLALMMYILIRLFIVAKNTSLNGTHRLIAIGCIGGILAFYGHGVFSVAQRMVVANLPLYTIFAISFAVICTTSTTRLFALPQFVHRLPALFWRFVPSTILIGLGWALFIPITISFYNMIKLQPELGRLEGVKKMEKLMSEWPNPYGLDNLMNQQLQRGRFQEVLQSAQIVKQIIPEYRTLGFKESTAYLYTGQIDRAKERALAFQERVGFHIPTITLLARIAAIQEDHDVFHEQLRRFFQHAIVTASSSDIYASKNNVHFELDSQANELELVNLAKNNITLSLHPDYANNIMKGLIADEKTRNALLRDVREKLSRALVPPVTSQDHLAEAVQLVTNQQNYGQRRNNAIEKEKRAFLLANRPRSAEQKNKVKEQLVQLERETRNRFSQQHNQETERLSEILSVDANDFLSVVKGSNTFSNLLAAVRK